MRTLFISDLDGTLLNRDVEVSRKSAEILSGLSRQGVLFTCATARTPATVVPLLSGVESTLPAIVLTGAALYDRNKGSYEDTHFISETAIEAIYEAFADESLTPFIYALPEGEGAKLQVYTNTDVLTPYQQKFVDDRRGLALKQFNLNTPTPKAYAKRHVLFFAMGNVENIERAAAKLRDGVDCQVSCYRDTYDRSIGLLEILASGVSKARAVLEMKARVKAERLVVYGDNLNDLPMMKVADVAVAVENALPEVKAAADVVIGANSDDSVAKHILALTQR